MKAFSLLMFVCTALSVSAIATRLGDRKTLVPPPEARVEAFLRTLTTGRSQLAPRYLSGELRARAPASDLQRAFRALEAAIGEVENVDARTISADRQSAKARGELMSGSGRRIALDFDLKWERGAWAIAVLPESLMPPDHRQD
jgi:hypothetical protein